MSKIGSVLIPIILVGLVGTAIYFFVNQTPPVNPVPDNQSPAPEPVDLTNLTQPSALPQADASETAALKAGGSSYSHPDGSFSLLYPNDYQFNKEGEYGRIFKVGPTQTGQTELYDGVLVLFRSIDLENQSLSDWVDEDIESVTADGSSKLTKAKTATSVNGYSGFSYTTEGLGHSNNIVLQKDPNSPIAVHIIYAAYDPTNAGFEKQVANILSTLQILK